MLGTHFTDSDTLDVGWIRRCPHFVTQDRKRWVGRRGRWLSNCRIISGGPWYIVRPELLETTTVGSTSHATERSQPFIGAISADTRFICGQSRPAKFPSYVSPKTYIKEARGQTGGEKLVHLATATATAGLQLLRLVIARLRRGGIYPRCSFVRYLIYFSPFLVLISLIFLSPFFWSFLSLVDFPINQMEITSESITSTCSHWFVFFLRWS